MVSDCEVYCIMFTKFDSLPILWAPILGDHSCRHVPVGDVASIIDLCPTGEISPIFGLLAINTY